MSLPFLEPSSFTPVLEPSSCTPVLEPCGVTPVLEPCGVTPVSEPSSDCNSTPPFDSTLSSPPKTDRGSPDGPCDLHNSRDPTDHLPHLDPSSNQLFNPVELVSQLVDSFWCIRSGLTSFARSSLQPACTVQDVPKGVSLWPVPPLGGVGQAMQTQDLEGDGAFGISRLAIDCCIL